MGPIHKAITNKILRRLTPEAFACLQANLSHVELPVRRQLEGRARKIEHIYFLERGLASMVISAGSHHSVEVGIIGSEGMTGIALMHGTDRGLHETFIQTAGSGWRIETAEFLSAIAKSPELKTACLAYCHVLVTQMGFTALSNARYTVEERLARWLLMAADRTSDAEISSHTNSLR